MYLLLLKEDSAVMKAWSCQRGAKLLSIEEKEGLREENSSRQNSGEITGELLQSTKCPVLHTGDSCSPQLFHAALESHLFSSLIGRL